MENILTRKLAEKKLAFYALFTLVVVYVRPSEINLENMVRYSRA